MTLIPSLSTRNLFGPLLNERELTGEAVEIGTHLGEFAKVLLDTWHGERLYCVDPWSIPEGYEEQAKILVDYLGGSVDRDEDYQRARELLREFLITERVVLVRKVSEEAHTRFPNSSLDFVYIDGNHERHYIEADIYYWWPKLKPGGILAGHDFVCPGFSDGGWGKHIQPAVLGLAEREHLDVYLVIEENGLPWSWWLQKPENQLW